MNLSLSQYLYVFPFSVSSSFSGPLSLFLSPSTSVFMVDLIAHGRREPASARAHAQLEGQRQIAETRAERRQVDVLGRSQRLQREALPKGGEVEEALHSRDSPRHSRRLLFPPAGKGMKAGLVLKDGIQKVLRIECLGIQELGGVVVDCVKEGDDIRSLCGCEAESVVQTAWEVPKLGFPLYRAGGSWDLMGGRGEA